MNCFFFEHMVFFPSNIPISSCYTKILLIEYSNDLTSFFSRNLHSSPQKKIYTKKLSTPFPPKRHSTQISRCSTTTPFERENRSCGGIENAAIGIKSVHFPKNWHIIIVHNTESIGRYHCGAFEFFRICGHIGLCHSLLENGSRWCTLWTGTNHGCVQLLLYNYCVIRLQWKIDKSIESRPGNGRTT